VILLRFEIASFISSDLRHLLSENYSLMQQDSKSITDSVVFKAFSRLEPEFFQITLECNFIDFSWGFCLEENNCERNLLFVFWGLFLGLCLVIVGIKGFWVLFLMESLAFEAKVRMALMSSTGGYLENLESICGVSDSSTA